MIFDVKKILFDLSIKFIQKSKYIVNFHFVSFYIIFRKSPFFSWKHGKK